jgi:hypothetical protein
MTFPSFSQQKTRGSVHSKLLKTSKILPFLTCFVISTCLCPGKGDLESDSDLRKLQDTLLSRRGNPIVDEVPLKEVKRILEMPPNILDAFFVIYSDNGRDIPTNGILNLTNFWRTAWAENGYFLSESPTQSAVTNLFYQGAMYGRYGSIYWRGSDGGEGDGGVIFTEKLADNSKYFGKDKTSQSRYPLNLGLSAIRVGTCKFVNDTEFTAVDLLGEPGLKGKLITIDGRLVTGIAYEVQRFPKVKYIATFLKNGEYKSIPEHKIVPDTIFPIRRTEVYCVSPEQTNFMHGTLFFYVCLTSNSISTNYFIPTNWIAKAPLSTAFVISNELYANINGRLQLSSSIKPIGDISPKRRWILISFLVIISLPLIYSSLKLIKSTKQNK